MELEVIRAPMGLAVDTSVRIHSKAVLDALASRDCLGVIRTVPLPGNDASQDVDAAEFELILGHPARFWSAVYQHPRYQSWVPRDHSGETDAQCAVRFMRAAGYPSGTTCYFDAEGMAASTPETEAVTYYADWCRVVVEEGYRAGGYAGYDDAMTAVDLWELEDCHTYFSDLADRKVARRGTALVQGQQFSMMGLPWDPITVRPDNFGETPWVTRAA